MKKKDRAERRRLDRRRFVMFRGSHYRWITEGILLAARDYVEIGGSGT